MRRAAAVAALLVAGCAADPVGAPPQIVDAAIGAAIGDGDGTESPLTAAATNRTDPTSATTVTTTATTTTIGPLRALLTPTGIPVAVIDSDADSYLVRAPCGDEVRISAGTPVRDIRVVIDPGHGGPIDTGSVGTNGLVERELNLTLAQAVARELDDRGLSNVLTRTDNYATNLGVRSALADDLDADVIVSIHHNAPAGSLSVVPGTEVFVQTSTEDSARLGALLYEEVTTALAAFDVPWSAFSDAGVLEVLLPDGRDAYGMVRNPQTTAVLIEMGNLANPAEAEFFATEDYLRAASAALADGIEAYLDTDRRGTGFGNPPRVFVPAREPGVSLCENPPLE